MRVEDWLMSGELMSAMGLGKNFDDQGGARETEGASAGGRGSETSTAAAPCGRATLEELYRKYRAYERQQRSDVSVSAGRGGFVAAPLILPGVRTASSAAREELQAMLESAGYASSADFEQFIEDFEQSFEREAARATRDLLERYAQVLHKEAARYRNPAELSSLHQKLGGLRQQHAVFEQNAQQANDYTANAERSRLPGNAHLRPTTSAQEAQAAHQRATAAKASAQREIHGLAASHPIFQEEGVPLDRRIDKAALAEADESALGGVLQGHLTTRLRDLGEAKALLEAKPELIYKLDKLFPQLVAQQGIAPGSVFAMILQDKLRDDAIARLTAGILVAAVSIALAVVSMGAATPAIAAGAAALGFGLSAGMAYQEIQEHGAQQDLADVGFAEDPSVAWLAVAVVGAAVDLGAAARAMKALGPAAQVVARGGDPAELTKLVQAYEKAGQLDAKIVRAVEKGAAARQGFFEAAGELRAALLGKAYAFPGPLADPDVFRHLVRLAKEGMGVAFHTLVEYATHLRLKYQLPELSSEEMVQVRRAWEQKELLEASAKAPFEIRQGNELIGRFSSGNYLEILEDAGVELYGSNLIRLAPNKTTTLTGTLADTNTVATRGFHAPGATLMGENVGGVNILRSPKWQEIRDKHIALRNSDKALYWKTVTDEFWETVNRPWLDDAIQRGDGFRFVSDPTSEAAIYVTQNKKLVLDNGQKIKSIFGREVDYLKARGYVFNSDGTAVRSQ